MLLGSYNGKGGMAFPAHSEQENDHYLIQVISSKKKTDVAGNVKELQSLVSELGTPVTEHRSKPKVLAKSNLDPTGAKVKIPLISAC